MKVLLTGLGIIVILAGLLGLVAPNVLLSMGRSVITPAGIYIIAALRIGVGILFIYTARTSRMPRTVRVLGLAVVLAGIATPVFGMDRSLAVLGWWSGQSAFMLRAPALIMVGIGAFVVYVAGDGR